MASLAELAISLNTTNLKAGLVELDKLSQKSGASEAAVAKLKKESSALAIQQAKLTATTAQLANTTQDNVSATLLAKQARQEHSVVLARSRVTATTGKIAIDKLAASEKQAAIDTARLTAEQKDLAASITNSSKVAGTNVGNTDKAAKAAGNFAHKSRMVSMQLSQVAQQGSVTGSYLQALAIQLPDLALGFGTLGVLIGAAAGSLAVFFVNAAKKAENASSDLKDEIDELASEYEDLAHAERELIRIQIAEEFLEISKSNRSLNDTIALSVIKFDSLSRQLNRGTISAYDYANATDEITRKNADLRAEISKNNRTIQERNDLLNQTARKEEEAAEAATKASANRDRLAGALQAVQQGQQSPAERAVREAQESLAIINQSEAAKLDSIKSFDELRVDNAQKLSNALMIIEKKTQEESNAILSKGQQAGLGILSGALGQAAALAKEGGEKQFNAYKGLAMAQSIVSTALAVNNALASVPPPFNIPLAATIGALGAVQMGIIANQSYQGARAMGGQVEAGGRFLVGENGPEVLQLGSQGGNVTPNHALGGGGGASVTNVFNIQAGVSKQEVTELIPTIINATKQAVQSEMSRGGTMSQSIGRRA